MRCELADGEIWVTATHQEGRLVGPLPGARWHPQERRWTVPATPGVYERLRADFPGVEADLQELASRLQRREEVRRRPPATVPDYQYYTKPWAHQIEATRFFRDMDAALLHCWMGTGKTKIALDAIRARGHRTILVLCPLGVITVWQSEIVKHAPDMDCLPLASHTIARRTRTLRLALSEGRRVIRPLLVILNYEAAWREDLGTALLACTWDCVILDESHRIKSPGARCSRFDARLRTGHRGCLTGTPMPHSPLDPYGQYRFLDVGIFGNRFIEYRDRYAVMGGYEQRQVIGWQRQDELRERMNRLRYHVKADVLDLPPLMTLDRECQLGPRGLAAYRQMAKEMVAELEEGTVTAANALAKLLRLQQCAAGFLPVEEGGELVEVDRAKRGLLADLLEDLHGEPVVVFARFRRDLEIIREEARRLGYQDGELSGAVNDYTTWREGEIDLLAAQLQVAGLGIDLTRARVALFYTLGYSLGDYQQCVARIHRPGQTRPAVVYRLLATGTVDRQIVRALDAKREVVESILVEMKGEAVHA